MRPERGDIAAPELVPGLHWFGGAAARMAELTAAGPVLVHFWELAQVNSVRTLPYVRAWHERYADSGLTVIGIHSPRYPFTGDARIVKEAAAQLEIPYRVASDPDHVVWSDYGCEGWPSLFLWGRGGALRWAHFGEGEYAATEEAIQKLLGEEGGEGVDLREENPGFEPPEPGGDTDLPAILAPLRPEDAPGALVATPTAEILPGGSVDEPWEAGEEGGGIQLAYEGGGAYAAVDGEGELMVVSDGGSAEPARRLTPGLFELAVHAAHEQHRIGLHPAPGQRLYSISFTAGLPAEAVTEL